LTATIRGAMDGVHVNGRAGFCHVVRRLFKCRQTPRPGADLFTMQIASLQKAIIANAIWRFTKNNLIHCF
jgi:hypothetical protein